MNKLKISFDFDSTLERTEIQALAESMLTSKHEVWIVTTRSPTADNRDMLEVAKSLMIPLGKIIFTHYKDKAPFLRRFDFHFDDDPHEVEMIMASQSKCVPMLVPVKIRDNYQLP